MTKRLCIDHWSRRLGAVALALVLVLAVPCALLAHPEFQDQIEAMETSLGNAEPDASWLMRRGDLYRRDGEFAAAGQDFAAARVLAPALPMLDLYEARLKFDRGDTRAAAVQLGLFLEQYPEHVVARTLRGDAWWKLGDPALAAADYGEAIRHSASPAPSLFLQQSVALIDAGGEHVDEAAVVLSESLRRFPGESSLVGLAFDLSMAEGSLDTAESYLSAIPEPLMRLPAWQARKDLLREWTSGDAGRAKSRAVQSLQSQLQAFGPAGLYTSY